jgi:hypothetical protein
LLILKSDVSTSATTLADRGVPVKMAISPKHSRGPRIAMRSTSPAGSRCRISTAPVCTT